MIVVFCVDTSPSMAQPLSSNSSISRLDVAKMVVEETVKSVRKGTAEQQRLLMNNTNPSLPRTMAQLGQTTTSNDSFLLLSTSRQYSSAATAHCGAAGRLLVGFSKQHTEVSEESSAANVQNSNVGGVQGGSNAQQQQQPPEDLWETFQRELKNLQPAQWNAESGKPFPDDAGGASGLNVALSAGVQLLAQHRLLQPRIENFGRGRLPCASISLPAPPVTGPGNASAPANNSSIFQPAVLVLVTDGACLRQLPQAGGGSLQLRSPQGLYREPFRWDQRWYCVQVGSANTVHPQLRALTEVTGGSHLPIRHATAVSAVAETLVDQWRPRMPEKLPLVEGNTANSSNSNKAIFIPSGLSFVNAGPMASFQQLDAPAMDNKNKSSPMHRAILLYTGSSATILSAPSDPSTTNIVVSPPLWFIPESFFPSANLDTLPPRNAQPLLHLCAHPQHRLGDKSFEPSAVLKQLQRLDALVTATKTLAGQAAHTIKYLHRDVYLCLWANAGKGGTEQPMIEYSPVLCRGAGRPSLGSDDASEAFLNIGILHIPRGSKKEHSTLTLLPPEPHILLPLLLRIVEMEHRAWKKHKASPAAQRPGSKPNVLVEDSWRAEFRAYIFRLPPYYNFAIRRALRPLLPPIAQGLLPTTEEAQCYSNTCRQMIRAGMLAAREQLERQGASAQLWPRVPQRPPRKLRYGQYDPRCSTPESFLAALRSLPPPWQAAGDNSGHSDPKKLNRDINEGNDTKANTLTNRGAQDDPQAVAPPVGEIIGDLPRQCLMAYYEARRRWLFGGSSLATRGLHADGINNGGSNSHSANGEDCLLTLGRIGVSTMNSTSTAKMGDYRERLLFSRAPVVGNGSNDAAGVSSTTSADGSPKWSVDNDALPVSFFNQQTGEFEDSPQARIRARLMVNFGNPFKEQRADSLIPVQYFSQAPSSKKVVGRDNNTSGPATPPGSPPHDPTSFDSVEEGEALFVLSRSSPKREEDEDNDEKQLQTSRGEAHEPPPKRAKTTTTLPPKPVTPPCPKSPSAPKPPPINTSAGVSSPKSLAQSLSTQPPTPTSKQCGPPTPSRNRPPPTPSGSKSSTPISVSKRGPPAPSRPPAPKQRPPSPPVPPSKPQQQQRPPGSKGLPFPPPPPPGGIPRSLSSESARSTPLERAVSGDSTASTTSSQPKLSSQRPRAPSESSIERAASIGSTATTNGTPSMDLQNPSQKPAIDLPTGWMCVWSKSQKRWYFFDTRSNKSVWEWPPK